MPAGVCCWDLRIEKMLVEYILVSILLVASAIPAIMMFVYFKKLGFR